MLIVGCLLGNHLTVQSANGHIYQSEGRLEMQNEGTGERIIIDSADIKENATRLDSYESDFDVKLADAWKDGYGNGDTDGYTKGYNAGVAVGKPKNVTNVSLSNGAAASMKTGDLIVLVVTAPNNNFNVRVTQGDVTPLISSYGSGVGNYVYRANSSTYAVVYVTGKNGAVPTVSGFYVY